MPSKATDAAAADDPQQIWQQVLHAVADRPAFGWLSGLALRAIKGRVADLAIKPGQAQLASFVAAPARQEQIARLLSEAVGKPITVRLDTTAAAQPAGHHASNASTAPGNAPPPGYHDNVALEQARKLPLVDQMLRTFPEASLINAYRESKPHNPTDDDSQE